MKCPACEGQLKTKQYEGIEVDQCTQCSGHWLDLKELLHIAQTQEETISQDIVAKTLSQAFSGIPQEEVDTLRKCPHCQKPLRPVNYDYSSGIIIDQCSEHGVWLDQGELDKAQAHSEQWREKAQANEQKWNQTISHVQSNEPDVEVSRFHLINSIIQFFIK